MRDQLDPFLPTRLSLLSRLKEWDNHESWRDFFDTYWRLIYGLAVKSGLTNTEAEDVVQETLLAVAKEMPDFKYDPATGEFKSWPSQINAAFGKGASHSAIIEGASLQIFNSKPSPTQQWHFEFHYSDTSGRVPRRPKIQQTYQGLGGTRLVAHPGRRVI